MTYELLFGLRCAIWCAVYLALVVAGHAVLHKWRRKLFAALIINLAACLVMFRFTKPVVTLLDISMFGVTGRGFFLMLLILWAADMARVLLAGSNLAVMRRGWAFWVVGLLVACGVARLTARDDRNAFEIAVNATAWDHALLADPAARELAVTLKETFPRDYKWITIVIARGNGKPDHRDKGEFSYLITRFLRSRFDALAAASDDSLIAVARHMERTGEANLAKEDCAHPSTSHATLLDPSEDPEWTALLITQIRAARDGTDHPVRRDFAHPPQRYVDELRRAQVPPPPAADLARIKRVLNQPSADFTQADTCELTQGGIQSIRALSPSVTAYLLASTFKKQSESKYALPR